MSRLPERHPIADEESGWFGITLRQMSYGRRSAKDRLLFSIDGDVITLHEIRHGARGPIGPDEEG